MYLALKALHITAVVLFLGNIITGVFWKVHADRTGDPKLMAHALHGVIRSDRLFTVPGVFLIIITGVWMAIEGGFPILRTDWIWQSLILFGIAGVLFGAQVAPLQKKMHALAQAAAGGAPLPQQYHELSKRWAITGGIATLTPLIALALMVLKRGV
ncbi:MAG: DUF2269 family protein [Gammaproteobacteria bacterium]